MLDNSYCNFRKLASTLWHLRFSKRTCTVRVLYKLELHASTERTEISVVVQNLLFIFYLWQQFFSKLLTISLVASKRFFCDPLYSHDLRRSSSNRVLTIKTDVTSAAVTVSPLLGSSWMLTRPSRKRDAHRDTVLRSTTLSPKTSCKALWNSVGFFPRKFSILMYDRWSLREIWYFSFFFLFKHRFAEQGPRSLRTSAQFSLLKSGLRLSRKSERLRHPTGHAKAVSRNFEMTYVISSLY